MTSFTPRVIAQRTKVVVVACISLGLAFICQFIALVTPGWLTTPNVVVGLFMFCGDYTVVSRSRSMHDCQEILSSETPGTLNAVRALVLASIVLTCISLAAGCSHLWHVIRHEKIHGKLVVICVLSGLIAIILTTTGAVVFGAKTILDVPSVGTYKYDLFYSFGLYVAGGIFTLLGAGLIVASVKSLTRLLWV